MPIRIATKSLRSRPLIERALGRDGFEGLMCYAVREALWWARDGHDNLLVAYPSVDVPALAELAADPALTRAVIVMIDSVEHVDFIAREVPGHEGLRVAVDVDASLRVGPAHLGVRRSPTRTPADVEAVIRRAQERGLVVAGLMFYDAQIAGLPDSSPVVRRMKKVSDAELRTRRAEVVAAARALADLEVVNGGGTGSLHVTHQDPSLTELAAGSGLFAPTLFDGYDALSLRPAAYFAVPVVRRPGEGMVTAYGGGYVASGPPGWSRVPSPLRRAGPRAGPARGRRRGADAPRGVRAPTGSHWVIGYGSGTPRQGSWPSASRSSRSSAATEATGSSDGPRPIVGKGSVLADSVGGVTRRVVRSIDWSNWAGTESARLARVATPRSEAEVVEEVARAAGRGLRVKAIGAGHSFTGVAVTDGVQLRLGALTRRHLDRLDARRGHASAPAPRCTCSTRSCAAFGCALPNLGDIDRQSDRRRDRHRHARHRAAPRRASSAGIRALRLVLADGSVVELLADAATPSSSRPPGSGSARSASSPR